MRDIEILYTDKNKLSVATDRITLRVHRLGNMNNIPIEYLQEFCKLVDENVFHKNTLRGKITYKNNLIKSKILIKSEYGRDGFTLIYNLETGSLTILSIHSSFPANEIE